eukprot:TRINITY_DN8358_c0_g1_i1.p1 TRINITY_DN8358_c0_g1~~TRINITY_DN8358_c0_g1_i1.p1  ORF type:complete len:265 (-),score=76.51 TRINITY_DN8358_c0_g1_i1:285-1079(-)
MAFDAPECDIVFTKEIGPQLFFTDENLEDRLKTAEINAFEKLEDKTQEELVKTVVRGLMELGSCLGAPIRIKDLDELLGDHRKHKKRLVALAQKELNKLGLEICPAPSLVVRAKEKEKTFPNVFFIVNRITGNDDHLKELFSMEDDALLLLVVLSCLQTFGDGMEESKLQKTLSEHATVEEMEIKAFINKMCKAMWLWKDHAPKDSTESRVYVGPRSHCCIGKHNVIKFMACVEDRKLSEEEMRIMMDQECEEEDAVEESKMEE